MQTIHMQRGKTDLTAGCVAFHFKTPQKNNNTALPLACCLWACSIHLLVALGVFDSPAGGIGRVRFTCWWHWACSIHLQPLLLPVLLLLFNFSETF